MQHIGGTGIDHKACIGSFIDRNISLTRGCAHSGRIPSAQVDTKQAVFKPEQ